MPKCYQRSFYLKSDVFKINQEIFYFLANLLNKKFDPEFLKIAQSGHTISRRIGPISCRG